MITVTVPRDVRIRGYVALLNAPPSEFVRRAAERAARQSEQVAEFHRSMNERLAQAKAARGRP